MAKYLFLIILGLTIIDPINGQIPNGSFEYWEQMNSYIKPVRWSTTHDTFYTRFERDTISIDGQYSMKIIPGEASLSHFCSSPIGTHVDFNSILPSNSTLSFYAKAIPADPDQDEGVYLRVYVHAFHSDTLLDTYYWYASQNLEAFTKVEIDLPGENIDALSIFIYAGASGNPSDGLCLSRSISWIDGMAIDSGTPDGFSLLTQTPEISIFPNPSTGLVHIRYDNGHSLGFELYSLIGELVSSGQIENMELTIYEKGTYMLRLFEINKKQNAFSSKLFIIK